MSAYICAFFALSPLYSIQAMVSGVALGRSGIAIIAIAVLGCGCTFLLLSLNRFARLAFVVFWFILVSAASYSWTFLQSTHDSRGAMGLIFLACCGLVLWNAINGNWPKSVARREELERSGGR